MGSQTETKLIYLEDLTRRMKETSAEANRFAGRFLFGGLIAVIGAINIDIVFSTLTVYQILAINFTAVMLALVYFMSIRVRIERLEKGYQKCKYLYEVIINSSLMDIDGEPLAELMEIWRLDKTPALSDPPTKFEVLLLKLHTRHKISLDGLTERGKQQYVVLPMALVILALIVKSVTVYLKVTIS